MLSHMPALYSSRMKGHECQLRTLQATALSQSTLQSHLIFFGKLESVLCCPTLHGGYFHVPCMHDTFIIHKKSTANTYKSTKIPDITIDMEFIKFVPGSEESQQEYHYKRIAAKDITRY